MKEKSDAEGPESEISITPSVRRFVLAANADSCQECGKSGDEVSLEIHHIKPKSEGGTNHPTNLTVYCRKCHLEHHRKNNGEEERGTTAALSERLEDSTSEPDLDPAPADQQIISAVETIGPASVGNIADEADVTAEYARRRLYALGGAKVVAKTEDRKWDLSEKVDNPAVKKLPENPEQAARFARDDIMRRMSNMGISHEEIAEIVGLDERTVPTAINRARAFDPPLPPMNEEENIDRQDLARQLMTLARRVDNLETEFEDEAAV